MRVLALDVGDRRIGVAASDPLGKTAQPLETLPHDDDIFGRLRELATGLEAGLIVVGLPLLMDGSEGAQSASVREFALRLVEELGLPVKFVDERLTTRQAEAVFSGEKMGRPERRAAADRVAAALILRAYLDSLPLDGGGLG